MSKTMILENNLKERISVLENEIKIINEFLENCVVEFFNDQEIRLI